MARMLLDNVAPYKGGTPEPAHDAMVRDWYVATTAWMQNRQEYDSAHVQRARLLFPVDADVLFLTGSQHETYASPLLQTAASSAARAPGVRFDVRSGQAELREAEKAFRQALAIRPDLAEAHLRLGRVLSLLGKPKEAVDELRIAASQSREPLLSYYADLFVGAALESLRDLDAARNAYEAASRLRPEAQSPRLALSASISAREIPASPVRSSMAC
jgi:tetratricopeptide (TPR) repeat protein